MKATKHNRFRPALGTLENRVVPAAFPFLRGTVPWDTDLVPTEWVTAQLDPTGGVNDTAFVAQEGGAAHVHVVDDSGRVLFSEVLFDPEFRGGGRITAVERPDAVDLLVVTPGPGGGPIARAFALDGSVDHTFLMYDPDYRGGVSLAATPGVLLAWPTAGPPNLRTFDPVSGAVTHSVWMAPEDELGWRVAPVGVMADGVWVERDGPAPGAPNPSTRFVPLDL